MKTTEELILLSLKQIISNQRLLLKESLDCHAPGWSEERQTKLLAINNCKSFAEAIDLALLGPKQM